MPSDQLAVMSLCRSLGGVSVRSWYPFNKKRTRHIVLIFATFRSWKYVLEPIEIVPDRPSSRQSLSNVSNWCKRLRNLSSSHVSAINFYHSSALTLKVGIPLTSRFAVDCNERSDIS